MQTSKSRDKSKKLRKEKSLSKLINNSDSSIDNDTEHELSFYINDRVKLMKEVLKIIKPKKIITMAPECMRHMDKDEINSILLEELLGISNKRLKYIFEGKNLDEESSSSEEDQPTDVISLDDVSDDDFVIISDEEECSSKLSKRKNIKEEPKENAKKIKKEKTRDKFKDTEYDRKKKYKDTASSVKEPMGEENLMSVLELLELQARARAIRSQLELENKRKKEQEKNQVIVSNVQDDDDEIIIEMPKEEEIVITSSDSEDEGIKSQQNMESNEYPYNNNALSEQEHQENSVNTENSQEMDSLLHNTTLSETNESSIKEKNEMLWKTDIEALNSSIIDDHSNPQQKNTVSVDKINIEDSPCIKDASDTDKDKTNNKNDEVERATFVSEKIQPEKFNSEANVQEQKKITSKEKKLRHLKNKLESYKRDIVADSNVKVLENIVIKQKVTNQSQEDTDDLVINVDQSDLDCIVCD